MIEIDYIPDNWTKDQVKIYEIYCESLAKDNGVVYLEAIEEIEKILYKWLKES